MNAQSALVMLQIGKIVSDTLIAWNAGDLTPDQEAEAWEAIHGRIVEADDFWAESKRIAAERRAAADADEGRA